MVKDTKQNNLYHFNIFLKVKQKSMQVIAKNKIGAPCKRRPLHGTLALEWFSFSRNV